MGLCIAWGAPIVALAIFLMLTIIGAPIAMLLLPLAAYPWKRTMEKRTRQLEAWSRRDHALEEGNEVPWEV